MMTITTVSVEYDVEGALDLSHRLRYGDNNYTTAWEAKKIWFLSWQWQGNSIYSKASRLALWPNQPPLEGLGR